MLNFYFDTYGKNYPFVHRKVFERLSDNFHQTAFGWISEDKLRTHTIFKTECTKLQYTFPCHQFRSSNHHLTIEDTPHPKTPKEERFCQLCPGKVEDEYHFLFDCKILCHLRQDYFEEAVKNIPRFENLANEIKVKTLMCEMEYDFCKYIRDSMGLRNFLTLIH